MIPTTGRVLVDFYADWCIPCKRMNPILEDFENKSEVAVVKINVDKHRQLALEYGVRSVPCFIYLEDGNERGRKFGFMPLNHLILMTKGV